MPDYTGTSSYPSSLDSFDVTKNTTDPIGQDLVNARAALQAIEDELGTAPSGAHATVKAAIEYLAALADAAEGPQGLPGEAPVTRVTDLVADPEVVTDWGSVINLAIADGVRHFWFNSSESNDGDFPFSTTIAANVPGLMLEGEGGATDHYGNVAGIQRMPAYLRWTGTGSTSPVDATSVPGFSMRNLGLYYDSGSFTGRTLDLRGNVSLALIDRCDIGSLDHEFDSALANVAYDDSWNCELRNCTFHGADYNILGATAGATFCDTLTIQGCHFAKAAIAHIGGIGRDWTIDDNFFGMALAEPIVWATPKVITTPDPMTPTLHSYFTFTNNSIWDDTWAEPWFYSSPDNVWHAHFEGNTVITTGTGPLFHFEGGGKVRIVNNLNLGEVTGALVDMGDTGGDAEAIDFFIFTGNHFLADQDAITNTTGHGYIDVQTHGDQTETPNIHTVAGSERLAWYGPTPIPRPTVAAESALGSGGGAYILGSDIAGVLLLIPGSGATGGKQATISLAKNVPPYPGSLGILHVSLTPINGAPLGGHSCDGDQGAAIKPSVHTSADTGEWALRTDDAVTSEVGYFYRVMAV